MASDTLDYDYIAYIDEAGDPGTKKVRPRSENGASEWFIVSCAIIPADKETEVDGWISEIMGAMNSRQMTDLHFAKLSDSRKSLACSMLAEKHVRLFNVISNKQNMQGYKNPFAAEMTTLLPGDNWFYCWMTRILLERITDYVAKHSQKKLGRIGKIKLVFSERGGLRYSQMHAYFQWINMKSVGGKVPLFIPWGFVDFRCLDKDLLHVYAHREIPALKMSDITASAFFRAVDTLDVQCRDASFAKLLRPIIARDPDSKMIAGCGVKLLPNMKTLNRFNVPDEKREIFMHYGYPQQWWQKVVEPGLV
jgi:hypothetical protein